ncbi:Putative cryptic C4-dicarboxylate transporter DcuD [Leclercia adecarboxylata]|uniref:Cryptic C4-dicarboxylate transporter DcuD n=1 Tax=Leclercia adecarboxylata TaxID=83655 RepID=A0A4V6JHQ5_9ENTR|nr:Putative cryptic C4-dicarboxylate transporter DcuD [Leclercia adecarboxylata]
MAVAHFFWQRYLDKKENISHERLDVSEITTTAPSFYAILPFTPIVGVLIFDGKWGPELHIITILGDLHAAGGGAGVCSRLQYPEGI